MGNNERFMMFLKKMLTFSVLFLKENNMLKRFNVLKKT